MGYPDDYNNARQGSKVIRVLYLGFPNDGLPRDSDPDGKTQARGITNSIERAVSIERPDGEQVWGDFLTFHGLLPLSYGANPRIGRGLHQRIGFTSLAKSWPFWAHTHH